MPNNDHRNLKLSQTAAEQLVQSVVDYAIFMLDTDGRIQSWNTGAERIKGYTAGEIIGEHFSRFYTEEDRAAGVPEVALKQAAEEGRFHAEGWRVRKDGRRFWAMVVIDPIFENGKLAGFAKVTRDITHHREMQLAALEGERRFRLLVQGVTDYAIYMLDPEGKITNWNTGAERIKGYSAAEILGQHFSTFYTIEDREAGLPQRVLEAAAREGRYEAEGWRVRKNGTQFWANVIVDAIRDDSGQLVGFAKVTRDLTERMEIQRQLEQSREQLFQAQKMEAIGQLTGGLAHDFNNLLTGISGSLDLLKTRLAQGRVDELPRYITSAQGAAKRAAALTHRLLAFARRQTLDPKPTNANDLVTGMEEMIRRTIGPTIEMETALAIGLWTTICDANQLENAILNLCINAKDAMPDGGRITIETANKWVDDQIAKERDMRPGQYIQVSVSDTGTGMPPDVVARAFDPFFTTKPTGEGTGLGLSMIYGFVRQSNGQVRIYTEVGKGTTVAMYLPRHWLSGKAEEGEKMVDEPAHQGSGGTVLVVDDEPLIRMLICEVLSDSGYRTIEAGNGATGLQALRAGEAIDLLITDVGLPGGMNGRQLADAAREIHAGLKILFITGYAENAAVGNGHLAPGMHVLTKPFVMEKLAAKVTEILQNE
ncbi:hybrid sensor histidine kinase/response regulator [Mesorhizobium sp. NZP2298]|uniref:hybrid sensor histidine kinase/response regulator n=1 Tax=Mesorhizobium sp. NZP2298 TaxID=2483403 RepID=UPI001555991D|nr:PAS domain-containing sensor histidine kinase [Mesorhizobium sp. NZP2298]QKC98276.1 PAS domain-containing sensor histidine kinase [Mesorhizobium sp. NZP2298]